MEFRNTRLSWNRPISDYAKVQDFYSALIRGRRLQMRGILGIQTLRRELYGGCDRTSREGKGVAVDPAGPGVLDLFHNRDAGRSFQQDSMYGNERERHVSHWRREDFGAALIDYQRAGSSVVYLLSNRQKADIRGFGHSLIKRCRRLARFLRDDLFAR